MWQPLIEGVKTLDLKELKVTFSLRRVTRSGTKFEICEGNREDFVERPFMADI
jgi:hypothetical protein